MNGFQRRGTKWAAMTVTAVRRLLRVGLFGLGVATVAAACGPTNLDRLTGPGVVAAALGRARAVAPGPTNQAGRPMAYLVLGGPAGERLAAFDLGRSSVDWTVPANVTDRVAVGSTLLVHGDASALVARDLDTGRERWRFAIPNGQSLVGYAVDGDDVTFVSRGGRALRGGQAELVALAGVSGQVRWRRSLDTENLAGPAARGGLVAVPNRSQYVTLFDGRSGEVLAEALSKDQAVNYVQAAPEGLFFGYAADGAFLLSPETAFATRASPGRLHAALPPFVRSVYHFDMYQPELANYSAIDRSRVLWRANVQGTRASFTDDTVCVLHYRFFFGFDAATGALRWAYNHPVVEAVSATDTGPSLIFVTADGELGALDPRTGQRTYRFRLPSAVVRGATFDADGFAPSGGDAAPTPALVAALDSVVWDPDRRFIEVKSFAVDELARVPGREVTAALLKILGAGRELMPEGVVTHAAAALVARKDRDAADLFVAALGVRTDFVDGTKIANLDVLARAAGASGAREAVAPLVEHLRLPETEPTAVVEIARALASLGAKEALPALRDYLAAYRADPVYDGDPSALRAVIDALLKLGGAPERELLLYVAEEPKTLAPVREYAREAVARAPRAP